MINVVIPVYNEESSLVTLLAELERVFRERNLGPYELILVDDGSRDGSWGVLSELSKVYPQARGIRFRRNFGKAAFVRCTHSSPGPAGAENGSTSCRSSRNRPRCWLNTPKAVRLAPQSRTMIFREKDTDVIPGPPTPS